ncbi:MAG: efflux RND transporter periplasmic adaptor subunit [Desulfosalsimonadaceae bacterium]
MNKKIFFVLMTIVCAVIIATVFNFRVTQSNVAVGESSTDAAVNPKTNPPETEPEELPDLDRPVDELWAAQCEHNIPQYTCDECRYELGVVKVSDTVINGDGKPGIITVAKTASMNFSKPLRLTGEVRLNEAKTVRVSSPLQGVIKTIPADIGGRFTAGDVLLNLDSDEVADAKAEYMKKAGALALARKTADREAGLFAKKISAEVDVQEAENRLTEAEIELRNAEIRLERLGFSKHDIGRLAGDASAINGILPVNAPITGTVMEKYASAGERVEAGKEIILLSDLSEVWVWANIREADLPLLQTQDAAIACEIEMPGAEDKTYPGALDVISGQMNAQTRTVKARIRVENKDGLLKPGMFVNVRVLLPGSGNVIAVPQIAVLADAGRSFVFVHKEGEYWVRRPVVPGDPFNEFIEIKEGLTIGQMIIADGSFLLKSDVLRGKMGAGCAD